VTDSRGYPFSYSELHADSVYDEPLRSQKARKNLPAIADHSEMVAADLGCGNGLLLELTHARVGRYYGVDFSSEFDEVKVSYLSHYLRSLSWLHGFSSVPVVGKYLKARRLFFECLA
jgi:hypothetical protein